MRRVTFSIRDRIILVPIEIVSLLIPMILVSILMYFIGGPLSIAGSVSSILAGVVLFPVLLPWIPTRNFSTKGFILGFVVALPFMIARFLESPDMIMWQRLSWPLVYLLCMPPITAFLALNFTGSTTFTSRSGVKREIFVYFPVMAWMFGIGIVFSIILFSIRFSGGV